MNINNIINKQLYNKWKDISPISNIKNIIVINKKYLSEQIYKKWSQLSFIDKLKIKYNNNYYDVKDNIKTISLKFGIFNNYNNQKFKKLEEYIKLFNVNYKKLN